MATHLAAFATAKGEPFKVQSRPTPKPGPGELLVEVKYVALNPADHVMRDTGLFIQTYPTVIGFDLAGLVLAVGDGVPVGEGPGLLFQPGITRIAAYGASFWKSCDPDYGAFQEVCLVPWQHAVPLPDNISWEHAATLSVSAQVPLNAWDVMGIPRLGEAPSVKEKKEKEKKREALLIWGASSSVGTMGVQSARLLRGEQGSSVAAVYATASAANHEYVASLGADRVFDHRDPRVVDAIVSAAKEDGLVIRHCFLAVGKLAPCQAVLQAFFEDDADQAGGKPKAQIASAPSVPEDTKQVDGVEIIFVLPSSDEKEKLDQFRYWIGTWLRENLAKGTIRPSPEPTVVGEGLGAINDGLDQIIRGISCTKLVVKVGK
ncbi:GroES-like protein [Nemania sp. NC0429]|nr:GroES-like protein [Nemania sp. NC0429]